MKAFIVVFDICSSTRILENLTTNENTEKYEKLVSEVLALFKSSFKLLEPVFYKFLGDGCIFFFKEETDADRLINMLCDFIDETYSVVHDFIKRYIDIELNRQGMTTGVTFGNIYETTDTGLKNEYYGRVINLACRLQNSLKEPEQANKILVQKEVYQKLKNRELRKRFIMRKRSFPNINADQKTVCYEIDPFNDDPERSQTQTV